MYARIFINKNGCLTKNSIKLTIINLLKDFGISVKDLESCNESINNMNFIQLNYEIEVNTTMPVIPLNLEIEKRLDFDYSDLYLESGQHLTEKWQTDSNNSKFTIYFNNFINKTNYLIKLIDKINCIEDYNIYKCEIDSHKSDYKKLQQQFVIKNEILSIRCGTTLILNSINQIVRSGNNVYELTKKYISDINLLIKRNNDCLFYFYKIKNTHNLFKGLKLISDPDNNINNNIISEKENEKLIQELLNKKNAEILQLETEILNIEQEIKLNTDTDYVTNLRIKILDINNKITAIEKEKYYIKGKKTITQNPLLENNIIYKINSRMENPEYFNEEYYIKLGYYFPAMQVYKLHEDKKKQLNIKINEINNHKHSKNSIVIMSTQVSTQNESELELQYNNELQKLQGEFQNLMESIPMHKYPNANEILKYSNSNGIDISNIVNINAL